MRMLQGCKIATHKAAPLPLEIVESERPTNCWDQRLAGGLICRRDVQDLRQRKHGENWWPNKATFTHFMYFINFINVMNLCMCVSVSQVYIISLIYFNIIFPILHDLLIEHHSTSNGFCKESSNLPIICLESSHITRFPEDFPTQGSRSASPPRWNPSQRLLQFEAPQLFFVAGMMWMSTQKIGDFTPNHPICS